MTRWSEFFKQRILVPVAAAFGKDAKAFWSMAVSDGVAELTLYGPVGEIGFFEEPSVTAKRLVAEIDALNVGTIRVRINSPGGSIPDGVAIYNALQRHPATVETYNDAEASSIAGYIFMVGKRRVMAANAMFMLHSARAFACGVFTPSEMREHADVIETQNGLLAPGYVTDQTTLESVQALLADEGKNHWYTPEQALAAGFATEVTAALPMAATADFKTWGAPQHLLLKLPQPTPRTEPTAGALGAEPTLGTDPLAPASLDGVTPMKWIAIAQGMALRLAANATEEDAKKEVLKALALAANASDEQVFAAIASRNAPAGSAPAAQPTGDVATAVATALDAENQRRDSIRAIFSRYDGRNLPQLRELETRCIAHRGTTPESAGLQLLTLLGDQAAPLAGADGARFEMGEDARDKRRAAMTQGLLARMGVRDESYDPANPFRGHRLTDLAREDLRLQGVAVNGLAPEEIAERILRPVAANTTSDLPNVLSNTMHKLVLMGFTEAPVTWDKVCRVGDVSDFRDWERHVPGLIGNFESVNEKGEYVTKNFADTEKATNRAQRSGLILAVTVETMVNDDIGYIQSSAMDLGRVGSRTIEAGFYTLLNSNPTVKGQALFHTDRGNLAGSGAAPTVDLIDAAASAMALQRAPAANGESEGELLDIQPDIILANRSRQGDLKVLIGAEYDPDTANKLQRPNKVRNLVSQIITSPRATAAPWYLFANPNVAPVFEVVFLNGQRTPRVVMQEVFRSSGWEWKAELPHGIGAIDFRGAYKNPGA